MWQEEGRELHLLHILNILLLLSGHIFAFVDHYLDSYSEPSFV